MPQNVVDMSVARQWDFLEPAIDPNKARTIHGVLLAPGAGLTTTYTQGQVVCQKDDKTNKWAKLGTAGYTGRRRLIKYTVTINENGIWQYGTQFIVGGQAGGEGSVAMYYEGKFKTQDLLPAGLTDDATAITVGAIIVGTRLAGIIDIEHQALPA